MYLIYPVGFATLFGDLLEVPNQITLFMSLFGIRNLVASLVSFNSIRPVVDDAFKRIRSKDDFKVPTEIHYNVEADERNV